MPDFDDFLKSIEESPEQTEEVAQEPAEPEQAPAAEATAEPAEQGETGEPPSPEQQPRDDKGRFAKGEKPDSTTVPLAAVLAERERRQAAEQRLRELEESAKPKEPEQKVDWFDDPEKAFEQRFAAREAELVSRAEGRARELFFKATENAARSRYGEDYDAAREAFAAEVERNPILVAQLREAPDPAEFIYRQGKTAAELRDAGGDLAAYRKRIEAEVRQRVEKELAEKAQRTASIPQSLNTEPSKGAGVTGGQWAGPTPLEDILPNARE